jgi:hypothetical protein
MKRNYVIEIQGKHHRWGFPIKAEPEHAEDWRADGFEVYEVTNTIPEWAAWEPLLSLWIRAQDAWQWLRLW